MKKTTFLIFFLSCISFAYTQSCDSFLQTTVDSTTSIFVEKLKSNIECGSLDQFDIEYCSPFWGEYYSSRKPAYTYGDFYTEYEDFKESEIYKQYRDETYLQFDFQQLKITTENWEKVKKFMTSHGVAEKIVMDYKNFIKNYSEDDIHGVAWKEFKEKLKW